MYKKYRDTSVQRVIVNYQKHEKISCLVKFFIQDHLLHQICSDKIEANRFQPFSEFVFDLIICSKVVVDQEKFVDDY